MRAGHEKHAWHSFNSFSKPYFLLPSCFSTIVKVPFRNSKLEIMSQVLYALNSFHSSRLLAHRPDSSLTKTITPHHLTVDLGYVDTVLIRPTLQVTRHRQLWREEFWPKSRVAQGNEDRDIPSKKNFPKSGQNRDDFCSEEMIFGKCHLSQVDLKSSTSLHKGHSSHGMKSRSY
jgi:hypothetical protein